MAYRDQPRWHTAASSSLPCMAGLFSSDSLAPGCPLHQYPEKGRQGKRQCCGTMANVSLSAWHSTHKWGSRKPGTFPPFLCCPQCKGLERCFQSTHKASERAGRDCHQAPHLPSMFEKSKAQETMFWRAVREGLGQFIRPDSKLKV